MTDRDSRTTPSLCTFTTLRARRARERARKAHGEVVHELFSLRSDFYASRRPSDGWGSPFDAILDDFGIRVPRAKLSHDSSNLVKFNTLLRRRERALRNKNKFTSRESFEVSLNVQNTP